MFPLKYPLKGTLIPSTPRTATSSNMLDEIGDEFVAEIMSKEALLNAMRAKQYGCLTYLDPSKYLKEEPKERSTRPNLRFLKNVLQSTVGTNVAISRPKRDDRDERYRSVRDDRSSDRPVTKRGRGSSGAHMDEHRKDSRSLSPRPSRRRSPSPSSSSHHHSSSYRRSPSPSSSSHHHTSSHRASSRHHSSPSLSPSTKAHRTTSDFPNHSDSDDTRERKRTKRKDSSSDEDSSHTLSSTSSHAPSSASSPSSYEKDSHPSGDSSHPVFIEIDSPPSSPERKHSKKHKRKKHEGKEGKKHKSKKDKDEKKSKKSKKSKDKKYSDDEG